MNEPEDEKPGSIEAVTKVTDKDGPEYVRRPRRLGQHTPDVYLQYKPGRSETVTRSCQRQDSVEMSARGRCVIDGVVKKMKEDRKGSRMCRERRQRVERRIKLSHAGL